MWDNTDESYLANPTGTISLLHSSTVKTYVLKEFNFLVMLKSAYWLLGLLTIRMRNQKLSSIYVDVLFSISNWP